jgi:hypothetical protein
VIRDGATPENPAARRLVRRARRFHLPPTALFIRQEIETFLLATRSGGGEHTRHFTSHDRGEQSDRERRVEVQGNRGRVVVKYDNADGRTEDRREYVAWVALGELRPGTYHLTLCDEAEGGVHVERRVLVPGGK